MKFFEEPEIKVILFISEDVMDDSSTEDTELENDPNAGGWA